MRLRYARLVALGPAVPEWAALADALAALTARSGARNVFVVDAWGHLWCRARAHDDSDRVLALATTVLARAAKPLTRGGRLDVGHVGDDTAWYARSFAGVYVVLLVFDAAFDELAVRRSVIAALPEIEALTVALPPPGGPDASSGAAKLEK
jgi:hypothetical protein